MPGVIDIMDYVAPGLSGTEVPLRRPWTGEFISMLWRHPNVYGDISAYFPKTLDPELIRAMDRQLRGKIMLGSNGFDLTRCVRELEELPLKDRTKERIMRDNAIEFLGL